MEPYLWLGGIRQHEDRLKLIEHLIFVTEQLEGMHSNLGLTLGQLNNDKDDIIDKLEEKYNVSFGRTHNKLDDCLQALYEERKELKNGS